MTGAPDDRIELNKDNVSDNVIQLLYQTVERIEQAQAAHSLSQPLLEVYEEITAERDVPAHDEKAAVALLARLAMEAREEERLMQRLRRVLGNIGMRVDFFEDGEGLELTSKLDLGEPGPSHSKRPIPARRGSLDSSRDRSADKVAGTEDLGVVVPSNVRSNSDKPATRADLGRWWQQKRRACSNPEAEAHTHTQSRLPLRPRTRPAEHEEPSWRSERSVFTPARPSSLNGTTGATHPEFSDMDESEYSGESAAFDYANVLIPGINAPIPGLDRDPEPPTEPEPFHPSGTRLLDDAQRLENQRLDSLVRSCIRRWRARTGERMERHAEMMQAATNFDRRILLRLAEYDLLREGQNRRALRETDRFFGRLEQRADRARNLFLLTKAFTHWASCAEDEVQRTSVARRHILRTRFFNGWREITAINELKIQHFVLGRFLAKWRGRTAEIYGREQRALQFYGENLQRRFYREWFFRFCGIAAPAWHNERLKRATFQQIRESTTVWTDRNAMAIDQRREKIKRMCFNVLRQKARAATSSDPQAEGYRRRKILSNALSTLQRCARFAPLLAQFQTASNTRLRRSSLQFWRQNTELSIQAKNVDRMRVIRNAWTAWNDRLRIHALQERINDRILVENMYRWSLTSRVSVFQRVHNRWLKETTLAAWRDKTRAQANSLDNAARRFALFKRTQLLRSCFRRIQIATDGLRAEAAAITVQYNMQLKQRIFDQLLAKHDHLQQLETWGGDAQFYVFTTHALKKLRDATQHARRNRRRDGYAQMRRTVKMNLVRRTFNLWREKAGVIMDMHGQANDMAINRTAQNVQTLFAHWQDRTAVVVTENDQAMQYYNNRLQAGTFGTWNQRLGTLQTMEAQAIDFRQISVEVTAVTLLKKLDWQVAQLQMRDRSVELHERHFRKHVRAMMQFWWAQTRERLVARSGSPTPTARARVHPTREDNDRGLDHDHDYGDGPAREDSRPLDDDIGDETRRLEGWTEFDQSAFDLSFSISPPTFRSPPRPRHTPLVPPLPPPSSSRPTPSRPNTYPPPPRSALRSRPLPPIPDDDPILEEPDATSTPMPPHLRAGYLKTPSKRSVVKNKRTDVLLGSPEKRARLGAMSAPPAGGHRDVDAGRVRSFGGMLREGGYGGGGGKAKRKARVEFG